MQLSITFADSSGVFPDVLFIATVNSLVKEAAEAAADEWDTDAGLLQLTFSGTALASSSLLVGECGVVPDSVLEASLVRLITKELLLTIPVSTLVLIVENGSDDGQTLRLDTPTFVDGNGLLAFDEDWIPEKAGERVEGICFANPDDSVVSVTADFLEGFRISSVDLAGLQHVRMLHNGFLVGCTSLTSLQLQPLAGVESVGDDFLSWCSSLTTVDFSGLRKVKIIGDCFLYGCESLESARFQFPELQNIGSLFMVLCKKNRNC